MDAPYDLLAPFFTTAGLPALLWACAWKSALLLGAAWLVTHTLLRGASAAARHGVWAAALVCVLVLPVLTVTLPGWTVPVPAALADLPAAWTARTDAPAAAEAPRPPASWQPTGESTAALAPPPPPSVTPSHLPAPSAAEAGPAVIATAPADAALAWPARLALLWLGGALVVLGYFAVGALRARRWGGQADAVEDAEWQTLLREVAWQLSLRRPVRLAWSDRAVTPMTRGVLRPEVLLPRAACSWTPERRRLVLLHELAHVERLDTLTQSLAQLACALYWFNPLVWWGARHLRVERERACDDRVLTLGTRASTYADHLLQIARSFQAAPGTPLGAVAMARPSQLEGRLLAILEPRGRRRARRAVLVGVTVLFAAAALPLAALRPAGDGAARAAGISALSADVAAAAGTAAEALVAPAPEAPAPSPAPRPEAHEAGPPTAPDIAAHPWPAATATAGTKAERTVTRRTFSVRPGGTLGIETDRGIIEVASGDADEVRVEVVREGDEDEIDRFRLGFAQNGDDVRVRGEYDQPRRWHWGDGLRVRYRVTVPRRFDVDLHTSGGSISVADLEGRVEAKTSGGSLRFGDIEGPVRGKTSGGSITLERAVGDAHLNTSGGSITLGDIDGDVVARTSGGSIRVGRVRGAVEAKTSGGSIQVDAVAGDLVAGTSGGSVRARITEQPRGDSRLTTSGGSVVVYLADGIGVDVDARTSSGRVSTDFDVPESAFDEDHEHLQAPLNGGGPALYLRTSAGRIRIERAGPATGHLRPAPDAEWQQAVEEAVEESRDAIAEAQVETQQAVGEALREALTELNAAGAEGGWLARTVAHAAVGLLEEAAFDQPHVHVEVDGQATTLCLVETLADLPDDAGRPALERVAEHHDDAAVRRHARALLAGKRATCPEET